jgi:hypothetical protein
MLFKEVSRTEKSLLTESANSPSSLGVGHDLSSPNDQEPFTLNPCAWAVLATSLEGRLRSKSPTRRNGSEPDGGLHVPKALF